MHDTHENEEARTHWTKLIVTDTDGGSCELGELVRTAPETLRSATIRYGMVAYWHGYFLAAPGEDADWDTPRGPVDWTGFAAALHDNTRRHVLRNTGSDV